MIQKKYFFSFFVQLKKIKFKQSRIIFVSLIQIRHTNTKPWSHTKSTSTIEPQAKDESLVYDHMRAVGHSNQYSQSLFHMFPRHQTPNMSPPKFHNAATVKFQ